MKIAVLGAGTVGVMTTCHFLNFIKEAEVHCIFDINKKILGIGESTNIQIPFILYKAAGFNMYTDSDELDATIKYGVLYKNWRKKDFFSPISPPFYAMHFNNFKLSEVIFNKLLIKFKKRFKIINGDIKNLNQDNFGVNIKINKINHKYDFVIDCRGYPEDYSEYIESDFLPINHALVYQIKEQGKWDFTYHQATKNGWMFGIPLKTRQGWGYLFNDKITSIEEAKKDIAKIFNTKPELLNLNSFKFKPYHAKKFLNNRIIKNGNRAIFYEPLEALSGVFYDNINRAFYDYIYGIKDENNVNEYLIRMAKRYENFICFAYQGGSIFNSKFWKYAKRNTSKHLKNNLIWEQTIDFIKNSTLDTLGEDLESFPFSTNLYKNLDKNFKYNIFN